MVQLKHLLMLVVFSMPAWAAERELFSHWELVPQVSVLTPSEIELVQTDYTIPYSDILAGFPAIHLGLATPLHRFGDIYITGLARAGFSYKRGVYKLPSTSRAVSDSDSDISLLWVPMSVGTKIQYTSPDFPYVRPSLSFHVGAEFVRQNSSIVELNTRAWLPYYSISPMIGFFEGASDTFNGFTFGISYIDSFAVVQKLRSWSFDLSFSFLL